MIVQGRHICNMCLDNKLKYNIKPDNRYYLHGYQSRKEKSSKK